MTSFFGERITGRHSEPFAVLSALSFSLNGILASPSLVLSHDVTLRFRLQNGGAERLAWPVRLPMSDVHVGWRLHFVRL